MKKLGFQLIIGLALITAFFCLTIIVITRTDLMLSVQLESNGLFWFGVGVSAFVCIITGIAANNSE